MNDHIKQQRTDIEKNVFTIHHRFELVFQKKPVSKTQVFI